MAVSLQGVSFFLACKFFAGWQNADHELLPRRPSAGTLGTSLLKTHKFMEKYLRKYFILVIILIGLSSLTTLFVITQLPMLLFKMNIEFEVAKNISQILGNYILYFFNLIVALIVYLDMRKYNYRSWPILILTVILSWAGVFFFLIDYSTEIINKNE